MTMINMPPVPPIRRVVTTHDARGKAVVMLDGPATNTRTSEHGTASTLIWCSDECPAEIWTREDYGQRSIPRQPPAGGSRFTVIDFAPGCPGMMHRTDTVDYVLCLSGEIDMALDDSEVRMKAGDVMVQQGTNHSWINRGAALHDLKDYRGALACYEKVLSLRPEHAAAWNNRGAAFLRLGEDARAAECFDEALHFQPDFFDAMVNRIFLSQRQGHHGEVAFWADRALHVRETAWLWYARGVAHLGLLEATLALRAFERAHELDPSLRAAKAGARPPNAICQSCSGRNSPTIPVRRSATSSWPKATTGWPSRSIA